MKRNAFQLLKRLKVIQLGPERETPLEELPIGAEVRVLRGFLDGNCVDIIYENERYFALKNELLCSSEDRGCSSFGPRLSQEGQWIMTNIEVNARASETSHPELENGSRNHESLAIETSPDEPDRFQHVVDCEDAMKNVDHNPKAEDSLRLGQKVMMTEGPFVGMNGTVVTSLPRRVVLSILLANREVQVEIERDWIVAPAPHRRSTSRSENPRLSRCAAG